MLLAKLLEGDLMRWIAINQYTVHVKNKSMLHCRTLKERDKIRRKYITLINHSQRIHKKYKLINSYPNNPDSYRDGKGSIHNDSACIRPVVDEEFHYIHTRRDIGHRGHYLFVCWQIKRRSDFLTER